MLVHAVPPLVADRVDPDLTLGRHSLLCLVEPAPRLPQRARFAPVSAVASVLAHIGVATAVMAIASLGRSAPPSPADATSNREPLQLPRMVYLQMPGPNRGGGGGGDRQATPAAQTHVSAAANRDRLTMPVVRTVVASEPPRDLAEPVPAMLDARPLVSDPALLAGLHDAPTSLSSSRGPGSGGGTGEGTGSGLGSGSGPGVGPGSGGGFGGGAYRLGGGVVPPTLLNSVRPKYTDEALRFHIQGTVALEVIVGRDGIPGAIRVTRSLDPGGLDDEAIAAVREWRFTPGRVGATPVDVLVTVFMDFRLN